MPRSSCCFSAVGTTFQSKYWLCLDPCGFVGICLSLSIHLFSLFEVSARLLSLDQTAQIIFGTCYIPCFLLSMWSLFMTWTTDPGSVPMGATPLRPEKEKKEDAEPDFEPVETDGPLIVSTGNASSFTMGLRRRGSSMKNAEIRLCEKCDGNFKPPRAHHLSIVGRCVVRLDHYCPWVCNAIGLLNHKFFLLFLFYTLLNATISIILIILRSIRCDYNVEFTEDYLSKNIQLPTGEEVPVYFRYSGCEDMLTTEGLILLILSLIFFIFSIWMLVEQIDTLVKNTTKISRMKIRAGVKEDHPYNVITSEVHDIFGGNSTRFAWHWLFPVRVWYPEGVKKKVVGYEWDPAALTESTEEYQTPYQCGGGERGVSSHQII